MTTTRRARTRPVANACDTPAMPRNATKTGVAYSDLDPTAEIWAHIEPESSRRLVLSALSAFAARGFHAATTREIGEGAGMSPAGVYVHYKSKHDLLFEISRVGHQANFDDTAAALELADPDPPSQLHAFISSFARWHCEHHTLARVIQYEFKTLPRKQLREIVKIRKRFEQSMRSILEAGIESGDFDVPDLTGMTLAVLSLCIDLARWYEPAPDHATPEATGEFYALLVLRMVGVTELVGRAAG